MNIIYILIMLYSSQSFSQTDFMWGISTSSYQTEDVFLKPQDPLFFKTDWDIFYDHGQIKAPKGDGVYSYSEVQRDLNLLHDLGITHYRFGIEWARIEPQPGVYNIEAINHYLSLVKLAKKQGIQPIICLWHFTFPSWAYEYGHPENYGWLSSVVEKRWRLYVLKIIESFKDEVEIYAPQNEPNAQSLAGFFLGIFPPGEKYNIKLYKKHIEKAAERFNEAADIIHAQKPGAKVISIQNMVLWDKAWWDFFSFFYDLGQNFNFSHLDLIKDHVDWIGFNYYYKVKASPLPNPRIVYPEGIGVLAESLAQRYGKPLIVTENGWPEKPDMSKKEYFEKHWSVIKSLRKKLDIRGYFYWSLIDNFEWSVGYEEKFGLYKFNATDKTLSPYPVVDAFKKAIKDDQLENR